MPYPWEALTWRPTGSGWPLSAALVWSDAIHLASGTEGRRARATLSASQAILLHSQAQSNSRSSSRICAITTTSHQPTATTTQLYQHTPHLRTFTPPLHSSHRTRDNHLPPLSARRATLRRTLCFPSSSQRRERSQSDYATHNITVASSQHSLLCAPGILWQIFFCDGNKQRTLPGHAHKIISQHTVGKRTDAGQRRHRHGGRQDEGGGRARRAW